MSGNTSPTTGSTPTGDPEQFERRRESFRRILSMYGGLFLFCFGGLILWGIYRYTTDRAKAVSGYEVAIIGIALLGVIVCVVSGARIMLSEATQQKHAIPSEDRELLEGLIRDGNEKGIDQYVRLSSLTGTTGTATKLGLSGLPLATVGLTIFFSVIAIFDVPGFLDLAKLTLGAFIGSFVQRNVSGERAASAPSRSPDSPP